MTGYQAKMGPMMPDPVGNEVVPSVYVKTVSPDHTIVVADGDRIDLRPWYSAKSALLIQGANSTYAALQACTCQSSRRWSSHLDLTDGCLQIDKFNSGRVAPLKSRHLGGQQMVLTPSTLESGLIELLSTSLSQATTRQAALQVASRLRTEHLPWILHPSTFLPIRGFTPII